ncbi:MAG TPA: hypothetical protein VIH99_00580 [Bdellovibrionota bacterium]
MKIYFPLLLSLFVLSVDTEAFADASEDMVDKAFAEAPEDIADNASLDASEEMADKFKDANYKCTDTPDGQGIYCSIRGTQNSVVIPKGVDQFEHALFYAHGLIGVCGNGASGENYLKNFSSTLRDAKAVGLMPWRPSASDAGYAMGSYMSRIDGIIGEKLPLLLAGHSAAGPFFATELNGAGASLVPRVRKVLLIDAIYGDQTSRWRSVHQKNSALKLRIVSTTTAGAAKTLAGALKGSFSDKLSLDIQGGNHCSAPSRFFQQLNSF